MISAQGVLAGLLLPALLAGGVAAAQDFVDPVVIDLKQIAIVVPSDPGERKKRVDAFRKATGKIRLCSDADQVAKAFRGRLTARRAVPLARLPAQIRQLLEVAGPNRATSVFGSGTDMRVLFQCGPARPMSSRMRKDTA